MLVKILLIYRLKKLSTRRQTQTQDYEVYIERIEDD